jgi:hypothetical protein
MNIHPTYYGLSVGRVPPRQGRYQIDWEAAPFDGRHLVTPLGGLYDGSEPEDYFSGAGGNAYGDSTDTGGGDLTGFTPPDFSPDINIFGGDTTNLGDYILNQNFNIEGTDISPGGSGGSGGMIPGWPEFPSFPDLPSLDPDGPLIYVDGAPAIDGGGGASILDFEEGTGTTINVFEGDSPNHIRIQINGIGNHDLLSDEHPDTTEADPVQGDLIVAQDAAPTVWTRFAAGGSDHRYLKDDGDSTLSWYPAEIQFKDESDNLAWINLLEIDNNNEAGGVIWSSSTSNSGVDSSGSATLSGQLYDGGSTGDMLYWDGSSWTHATSTEVTVITDIQYDTSSHKIQVKTRTVRVVSTGSESSWTDKISATSVSNVTNDFEVDTSTPKLAWDTSTLYVLEEASSSSDSHTGNTCP